MIPADRRRQLRKLLSVEKCISLAHVFDPISARIAESLGFEAGRMAGSEAAAILLGYPNLTVLTLTEFAD